MELPAGSRLLVEGRFGRLTRDGKTLAPDTRKGLLRVLRVSFMCVPEAGGEPGQGARRKNAAALAARVPPAGRTRRRCSPPRPPD